MLSVCFMNPDVAVSSVGVFLHLHSGVEWQWGAMRSCTLSWNESLEYYVRTYELVSNPAGVFSYTQAFIYGSLASLCACEMRENHRYDHLRMADAPIRGWTASETTSRNGRRLREMVS
jgi:hypothetical protein